MRAMGRSLPLWIACLLGAVLALTSAHGDPDASPPGARQSPTPSEEVFPPASVPLNFQHDKHAALSCAFCHSGARTSDRAGDSLRADPSTTCDTCHASDHAGVRNLPSPEPCATCHTGEIDSEMRRVARVIKPPPNLHFSHKVHADRNIACGHCHGQVEKTGTPSRDLLPRMAGCVGCHHGRSATSAPASCDTCHITTASTGQLETVFSTGRLLPPSWMAGAEHVPGFAMNHRQAAAENSQLCANCHDEPMCASCHAGSARPQRIHPGDFLSVHGQAAKLDSPRCVSCHQMQSFCGDCHRRLGVSESGPSGEGRGRFHPPTTVWTTGHAREAQRNLTACVSCHTESDCTGCHASRGNRGGAGISPHGPRFAGNCSAPLRKNPRACLVCHDLRSPELERCR